MTCLTYLRTLPVAPAAVVVCCLLLAVVNPTSSAAVIEYSWEGTIEPLDPNEDPWDIGAEGKPFFISVEVDENAIDRLPDTPRASFGISNVVFLIDDMPPTFINPRSIGFSELASRDSVDISLQEVEFNGVRERFFTGVRLSTSTFKLGLLDERPPVFSPTLTITGGGTLGDGSSYRTITDANATVTATLIPEPSTFVLALLALAVSGSRFFGRKCVFLR